MSIEVKKPTKEFYDSLDIVITHQIKSRDAFNRAIEIGREQGFTDFDIALFIKQYMKNKIPKTSLYRYLRELDPDEKPVPMAQIDYNNVLEQRETQKDITQYSIEDLKTLPSEELKEVIRFYRTKKLEAQDIADAKGISFVDKIEDRPGFLIQKAMLHVTREMEDVNDGFADLVDNWNGKYKMDERLSKLKPEKREEIILFIRAYSVIFESMNDLLKSCYDEKYSFSLWKWAELMADVEKRGYGFAREKHKIEMIDENGNRTGKYRKVTVEEIKKCEPKVREFMKKMVMGMKASAYVLGLVELEDIRLELIEYLDKRDIERYGYTLKEFSRRL